MKTELKITLIAIIAIALVLIALNFTQKSTGQATLTPGANYAAIDINFNLHPRCTYISEDNGWDVTKKTIVESFNKLTGNMETSQDTCEQDFRTVRKYRCEDGYKKERLVRCPSGTACDQGVCVKE